MVKWIDCVSNVKEDIKKKNSLLIQIKEIPTLLMFEPPKWQKSNCTLDPYLVSKWKWQHYSQPNVCMSCGVLVSKHKYIMTNVSHWLDFYGNEDFFFFTEELRSLFLFYFFLTPTFCFAGLSSDSKSHSSLFFFLLSL